MRSLSALLQQLLYMLEENRALQEQLGIHLPELMHPVLGLGRFVSPLGIHAEDEVDVPRGRAMGNFHEFSICGTRAVSRITVEPNPWVGNKFSRRGAVFLQRLRALKIQHG